MAPEDQLERAVRRAHSLAVLLFGAEHALALTRAALERADRAAGAPDPTNEPCHNDAVFVPTRAGWEAE